MANSELTFQGVSVNTVFSTLANAGIQADVARDIAAIWIGDAALRGRTFGYSVSFPATDPAGEPVPFARSFVHVDWIDGESAVQAGQTPTEQGFNDRFHRIEADLDRLGAMLAQLVASVHAMRGALATSLDDIRNELNRLNADVTSLRRGGVNTGPVPSPTPFPRFVGKSRYFDQTVNVWQDADGRTVTLPDVTSFSLPAVQPRAPAIAETLAREADIQRAFPAEVRVKDLAEKFGNVHVTDGRPLSDVLSSVPADQVFPNLGALVSGVAEQDAALLKGVGADRSMLATLGVAAGQDVAAAPASRVEGVTPALSDALRAANVTTVSQLASTAPEKLVELSRAKGVSLSLSDASALNARVQVIGRLRP